MSQLGDAERRYESLFNQTNDVVLITDLNARILEANPVSQAMLGYSADELIGKVFQSLVAPEELDASLQVVETLRRGERLPIYERRLIRKDGSILFAEMNAALVVDSLGEPECFQIIIRDISEWKQAAFKLQESEQRSALLMAAAPVGIFLTDANRQFVYVNKLFEQITGLTQAEASGEGWMRNIHPEDHDRVLDVLAAARRTAGELTVECRFQRQDETVTWVLLKAIPLYTEAGVFDGSFGVMDDITARVQMERALAENEQRYRHLIENASDIVYTADTEGRFTYVNAPAAKLTGYSEDELLTMHFSDLVSFEHRQSIQAFYAQQYQSLQQETSLEFPIITREGDQKWVEQTVTLIVEDDTVLGFESFVRDITRRKSAEAAAQEQHILAESLSQTSAVINSSLDLAQVLDHILGNLGRVVSHDMANMMLIRSGIAEVVRARGYEDWDAELAVGIQMPLETSPTLKAMHQTGKPIIIGDVRTDSNWTVDETRPWYRSYAGVPIQLDGEVIGFLNLDSMFANAFSAKDIAKLEAFANQAAIAIKNARLFEEIQERNKELDSFSHTVAHDLKSPLQMIIGYITLLKAELWTVLDADTQDLMTTVAARTVQMAKIIDSLLLFSTLRDASEQISPVQIAPLVQGALARFEDRIRERRFQIEVADEFPAALGYGPWIEEVLANLISNAVKYIGKDNPAPRIAIRGIQDGEVVRFEIEDNGLGIKPDDQKRLFEMFSRFHKGEEQGFGLGMSIIQRIVGKLGGTIGVRSEPGVGSTFWFTLPALPKS